MENTKQNMSESMKIDVGFLKNELYRHIEECQILVDKLSNKGDPLDNESKDLLRMALLSHVKVCQSEFNLFFINGNTSDMIHNLDHLHDIANTL